MNSTSSCNAYKIKATQNGNTYPVSGAKTISLFSSNTSAATFYSDLNCSSSTSSVTIADGDSQSAVFYVNGGTSGYAELKAYSASGGFYYAYLDIGLLGGAANKLVLNIPLPIIIEKCYRGRVRIQDASNNPSTYGSAVTANLSKSGLTGDFYSDYNCTSASSAVSIPIGQHSGEFYFKFTSTATGNITVAHGNGVLSGTSVPSIVPQTNVPSTVFTNIYSSTSGLSDNYLVGDVGTCFQVEVQPRNDSNSTVNAQSELNITVSVRDGSDNPLSYLYTDSGCLNSSVSSYGVTINSGDSRSDTPLYFKIPNSGLNFFVDADDGAGGLGLATRNILNNP